jgi:hypothetical protein
LAEEGRFPRMLDLLNTIFTALLDIR